MVAALARRGSAARQGRNAAGLAARRSAKPAWPSALTTTKTRLCVARHTKPALAKPLWPAEKAQPRAQRKSQSWRPKSLRASAWVGAAAHRLGHNQPATAPAARQRIRPARKMAGLEAVAAAPSGREPDSPAFARAGKAGFGAAGPLCRAAFARLAARRLAAAGCRPAPAG